MERKNEDKVLTGTSWKKVRCLFNKRTNDRPLGIYIHKDSTDRGDEDKTLKHIDVYIEKGGRVYVWFLEFFFDI